MPKVRRLSNSNGVSSNSTAHDQNISVSQIGTKYTSIQMEGLQHNCWKQESSSATSSQSEQLHLRVDHDLSTRDSCGDRAERKRESGSAGLFSGKICISRAQSQNLSWHALAFCYMLEHACAILVAIPAPARYTVIHARACAHALSLSLTPVHVCAHNHTDMSFRHNHIYIHGDCDPCHSCSLLFTHNHNTTPTYTHTNAA